MYTKDGKSYTKDVGDYGIKTALTNQFITNYNVKTRNAGKVTLTPVEITVDNEMVQTYGSKGPLFQKRLWIRGLSMGTRFLRTA